MLVYIEVLPVDRFPGQRAYEASVKHGPEWMSHQQETASSAEAAFERFANRLISLYSHRSEFQVVHA